MVRTTKKKKSQQQIKVPTLEFQVQRCLDPNHKNCFQLVREEEDAVITVNHVESIGIASLMHKHYKWGIQF